MAETHSFFARIQRFMLPAQLLEATVEHLRAEGQFRVESIVFWAGRVDGLLATMTHLVVPRGSGVFKHPLQVRVSEDVIAEVCELLDPPHLVLLGQVHTHMGAAFHSPTDDRYSLDTPGYLSLVVPDFAREDASHWTDWAFHECDGHGAFRRLSASEAGRRFIVDPTAEVIVHVAG